MTEILKYNKMFKKNVFLKKKREIRREKEKKK